MWGVEEPEPDPFEATAAPDELSAKLHGQPEPLFDQVLATLRTIPGTTDRAQVIRRGERKVLPAELRYAIAWRDHRRCVWCGTRWPLEIDHIVPWSAGGSDHSTNLRTLCQLCNQTRSNFLADEGTQARPLTLACTQCDPESDDTAVLAFCLACQRVAATRADQLKRADRYQWTQTMSWPGFKMIMGMARQAERYPC
jgi:DNA-binding transcriptional regulator YdaS (Cro superfamily)